MAKLSYCADSVVVYRLKTINFNTLGLTHIEYSTYRRADKSLARPRRKQATATEDFDVHISYL